MKLLGKFFVWVGVAVLKLCDLIYELFRVLAGIAPVASASSPDKKVDILSFFGANSSVSRIFAYILLVSIGIGFIFTLVSLIKNAITLKKTPSKVFSQYLWSVLSAIAGFAILLTVFMVIGNILGLIDEAFRLGGGFQNQTPGERIMELLVRQAENNMNIDPNVVAERRRTQIVSFKDKSIASVTNEVMGLFKESKWTGLELVAGEESKMKFFPFGKDSYKLIRDFFPYAVLLVAAFTLLFCSFGALFALCIRLFDIVFLQFAMPLCLASWSYDDGARFKMWVQTMFSKLILAFGTIFAVNTFMVFIPMIMDLNIPGASPAIISLFRIFLVVCGGFTISSGQTLFARLVGTDASEARQMGGYLKHAIAGVGATIGTMKKGRQMLKNGLFGKKEDAIGTALQDISQSVKGGFGGGAAAGGAMGAMLGGGGGAVSDPRTTFTGRTPYSPMKFKGRQQGTGLIARTAKAYNTIGRILGGDAFVYRHNNNMNALKKIGAAGKQEVASVGDAFMRSGGLLGLGQNGVPFQYFNKNKNIDATNYTTGEQRIQDMVKGGK